MVQKKNKKHKNRFMRLTLSLPLCGHMEEVLEAGKMIMKFLINLMEYSDPLLR